MWELSVQAWDEGGNGEGNSVPFTLTLTDINDNAPYLIQVRWLLKPGSVDLSTVTRLTSSR